MEFTSNEESRMYRDVDYPDSISDDMKEDYPNGIGKMRFKYPSGNTCDISHCAGSPLPYFNRKAEQKIPKLSQMNLQHEFQAALSINGIHLDSMDLTRRICSVTAKVNENVVVLLISFPTLYPRSKTPVFRFLHGTTVGAEARTCILKSLNDICDQHVMRKEACFQSCLEKLIILLNRKMDAEIDTSFAYIEDRSMPMPIFSANESSYLVSPKYCGAKFCSVGTLVCFSRQMNTMYNNMECASSVDPENNSIVKSQFIFQNSKQPAKMEKRCVLIFNASALMLISRRLCVKYSVTQGNLQLCCEKHAEEASVNCRPDLVNVWTMAAYGVSSLEHLDWDRHPLGKKLLRYIIGKCVENYDVQTAAMIYCMLLQRQREYDTVKSKNKLIRFPGYNSSAYVNLSPYHTISTKESKLEKWIPALRKARSNSWSDYAEVVRNTGLNEYAQKAEGHSYIIKEHRVSQDEKILYEDVKNAYAGILYKWGLLNVRASVMKCSPSPLEQHRPMDVVVNCSKCRKSIRGNACDYCKAIVMRCSICRLPVKGAAVACIICTHGGHLKHIESWFNTESTCASGCGCLCLLECSTLLA